MKGLKINDRILNKRFGLTLKRKFEFLRKWFVGSNFKFTKNI